MRALRFLVVILALATGEGIRAQTMPPAPTLTGVISGVVRDMATGAPLAGVAVHLTPIAGSPRAAGENPYDIETDDRGQFAFTKLPAGRYSEIRAHLGGFFVQDRPAGRRAHDDRARRWPALHRKHHPRWDVIDQRTRHQ